MNKAGFLTEGDKKLVIGLLIILLGTLWAMNKQEAEKQKQQTVIETLE